jgi:chemotaxis protein CheX
MSISPDEIHQVVHSVWEIALGEEIVCVASDSQTILDSESRTAFIQITGAWDGVVVCRSTHSLLREVAANMFATPFELLSCELIHDAFGEITNMIAGNLKALLPSPCFLCLPTVVTGSDYVVTVQNVRPVVTLAFELRAEPFTVELLEIDPSKRQLAMLAS